jgi:hypothetical protein
MPGEVLESLFYEHDLWMTYIQAKISSIAVTTYQQNSAGYKAFGVLQLSGKLDVSVYCDVEE